MTISSENMLLDALHCASLDVTRGIFGHQRYARGIVVGMIELVDSRTGAKHWLSDGVDCVSAGTEGGDYLSPGDPGFAEIWEQDFNDNVEETLAAYWPEEDESETETQ